MKRTLLTSILTLICTVVSYAQGEVISMETADKGYYLVIEEKSGEVWQGHFGDKLSDPSFLGEMVLKGNPAKNTIKSSVYPTFGIGYTGTPALTLTHADGNMTTRLVYDSYTQTKEQGGDVVRTDVVLKDEYYPLSVTMTIKAYQTENIFTSSTKITHSQRGNVVIHSLMSSFLTFNANDYFLTRYYGAWAAEMQMVESKLEDGITVIDSKKGVRTTQDGSPSFILSFDQPARESSGEVILGSLAWSGNYKLSFEYNNMNKLDLSAGVNDFLSEYTLARNEVLESPEFVIAHSNNGVGEASRNLHRWVRRYNIQDGDKVRPIVLNSWEGAYFRFDEEVIKNMIVDAASMGVEMFVLDDGWFGNKYPRNTDKMGLGDWQVNTEKLPNGLQSLIECAEQNNIEFGLWVEPEMVNPQSELAERHPDWIVTSPNREPILARSQLLLDLTNPKVQEFVHSVVADVLSENPEIRYIKWDANRHVEDFGSKYLPKDKQSQFWIDYIKGLYSVYDRLIKEFPDVIFQCCSSGAGRVDYGSLKYHHEVWGSDNTDGEWRIWINWGLNQFFPSISVASHVSHSPNHQTDHVTPIKFRFDVSMAQRLGLELQPKKLSEEELAWTHKAVAVYKECIRPTVQLGDQYKLLSPYDERGFASMAYVDGDKSRAILFVYSFDYHLQGDYPVIKLQGLDPNKMYKVNEILPKAIASNPKYAYAGEGSVLSGDFLMKYGMRVEVLHRYDSAVFEIVEVIK